MKNIFIDTSIYISDNFNFEGEKYKALIDLVRDRRIQLYTTTITDNEIMSNIVKQIDETRQLVNSITSKAYVLRNTSPFKSVFANKKVVNIALDEVTKQYEEYKKKTNAITIPINTVDVDDIFKRYFEELPPFSSKKKDEIPDAFTLSAVKKWFHEKDDSCYILSKDSDMKNYCEGDEKLIYQNSIDSLLDIIASEDANYKHIISLFETIQDDVLDLVKDNLFEQSFELSDLDGDVNEVDLGEIELSFEPLITEIGIDFAKISLQIHFEFVAHCSVFDITASPYDSETKGYLWKEYTSEVFHGSQELPVEITLTNIDFEQFSSEDLEVKEININNNETIFISTWYDDY